MAEFSILRVEFELFCCDDEDGDDEVVVDVFETAAAAAEATVAAVAALQFSVITVFVEGDAEADDDATAPMDEDALFVELGVDCN